MCCTRRRPLAAGPHTPSAAHSAKSRRNRAEPQEARLAGRPLQPAPHRGAPLWLRVSPQQRGPWGHSLHSHRTSASDQGVGFLSVFSTQGKASSEVFCWCVAPLDSCPRLSRGRARPGDNKPAGAPRRLLRGVPAPASRPSCVPRGSLIVRTPAWPCVRDARGDTVLGRADVPSAPGCCGATCCWGVLPRRRARMIKSLLNTRERRVCTSQLRYMVFLRY